MIERRNVIWYCAAPLIVLGLLLQALLDGSGPGHLIPGYLWGTLFGHTTLAAAWTAFGPLRLLWRLPLALLWLAALPVALFCNLRWHYGSGEDEFGVVVAACLAGQFAVLQLPFWGLALRFGLRIRFSEPNSLRHDPRETQFGIRQLLVFTTIIAAVLGAGRLAVIYLPQFVEPEQATSALIFLAVAAVLVTLPLTLAALLPRLAVPAVAVVFVPIGLLTFFELPLLNRFHGGIQDRLLFVFINGFTAAWILTVVLIVRICGYRLNTPRTNGAPEE